MRILLNLGITYSDVSLQRIHCYTFLRLYGTNDGYLVVAITGNSWCQDEKMSFNVIQLTDP